MLTELWFEYELEECSEEEAKAKITAEILELFGLQSLPDNVDIALSEEGSEWYSDRHDIVWGVAIYRTDHDEE